MEPFKTKKEAIAWCKANSETLVNVLVNGFRYSWSPLFNNLLAVGFYYQ